MRKVLTEGRGRELGEQIETLENCGSVHLKEGAMSRKNERLSCADLASRTHLPKEQQVEEGKRISRGGLDSWARGRGFEGKKRYRETIRRSAGAPAVDVFWSCGKGEGLGARS